ncbi:MAG: NAD/NADP octopine/nopaline dehydrogenase family protein [Oscillibacter sp.]|jgi:opine dehydrogenase|nr:NAD/NADP octopine/nopaline dehydrogenase family protein [Oscillibacter sp.]
MKFAVIGAGNTGHAVSAYLAHMGADVCLYTRSSEKAELINRIGITASGSVEGTYRIACTSDLAAAVKAAGCIVLTTTADVHHQVLEQLKPLLERDQKILITNANWGAFEGKLILGDDIREKNLWVAETSSQLCVASSKDVGSVTLSLKSGILLAATEKKNSQPFVEWLKPYIPGLSAGGNIVMTTLCSTNPVIHVPITVLNAVRTENGEPYKFYGNGISPLTVRYIEKIDAERVAVARSLGVEITDILTGINSFWPVKHDNLFDALHENEVYQRSMGPKSFNFRYITEDIPYGIAPVCKIGRLHGVDTPYTEALVRFASLLIGRDFMAEGVSFRKGDLSSVL